MSTTPKAWMVTIHYGDGETGAASDVYAGTPEAVERIAEERSRGFGFISSPIPLYAEVAQPLADERDELREIVVAFVQWMKMQRKEAPIKKAEAYLTKYPQP